MQTIGSLAWLWFLSFLGFGSYTAVKNLCKLMRLITLLANEGPGMAQAEFEKDFNIFKLSYVLTWASGILFALSLYINLVRK